MSVVSDVRAARLEPTPVDHPHSASPLGVALDVVSDMAILAFAVWTLLAYLAMLAGLPVMAILVAWFITLPIVVFLRWRLLPQWSMPRGNATYHNPFDPARIGSWAVVGVAFVAAAVAAVLAGESQTHLFDLAWLLGLVAVGLAAWAQLRIPSTQPGTSRESAVVADIRSRAWLSDIIALVIAVGSGVLSLFVLRTDADDVYYINRASTVADLGRIPTRDVLLSNGHFPPVAGTGSPVDAIAPLEGALARLVGVHGATVAYLVEPPIAVALAVWALWRLTRHWAPRRALLCFLLAVVYLYEAGSGHLSFGNFFLTRIQEGKVVFVSWMLPTLFVYLTTWARRSSLLTSVLIATGCIGSLGLTSSATFDVPLVVLAGALPLVVARRWGGVILPLASAAFPLVVGTICSRLAPPSQHLINNFRVPQVTYGVIVGIGLIAVIGGLALWLGPWLVRDRQSQLIVLGTLIVALVALAPKVMFEVHNVISLGGALQRVLWVVPLPVLVGLLAAYPPVSLVRRTSPAAPDASVRRVRLGAIPVAAALAVLLIVDGAPILSYMHTQLVDHPTWKVRLAPQLRANAVTNHVSSGVVLAPLGTMAVIAIESGKVKTVDPRALYTRQIPQPKSLLADRFRLDRLAQNGIRGLSHQRVSDALRNLHVTTVCIPQKDTNARTLLEQLGYSPRFRAPNALTCLEKGSDGQ
jgi:hypothetical protein